MVFWLDGESRLLAGMNINVWDVTEAVQALIRSRAPLDEARLRRPRTCPSRSSCPTLTERGGYGTTVTRTAFVTIEGAPPTTWGPTTP